MIKRQAENFKLPIMKRGEEKRLFQLDIFEDFSSLRFRSDAVENGERTDFVFHVAAFFDLEIIFADFSKIGGHALTQNIPAGRRRE